MTVPTPAAVVTGPAVALYVRVSTSEQDLVGQERELRAEAQRRGWSVVSVYSEKVSATGRVERSEYDRLLRAVLDPDRSFDRILVWALDRFSREETFTRATQTVLDLERRGVRFFSLKEPTLDSPENGTRNLGRDVLLALLPVIASYEAKRISDRTRVAMAEIKSGRRATKSGRPPGRQRRVWAEQAEEIARLRRSGMPYKDVAIRVGLPKGTCRRVMTAVRRGTRFPSGPRAFKTPSVHKGLGA